MIDKRLLGQLRKRLQHELDDVYVNGMCAVYSWAVYQLLKVKGFKPTLCCNSYHVFVKSNDWYVDLTADQFNDRLNDRVNLPAVWLSKQPALQKPRHRTEPVHRVNHSFKSAKEFHGYCSRWDDWQQPLRRSKAVNNALKPFLHELQ